MWSKAIGDIRRKSSLIVTMTAIPLQDFLAAIPLPASTYRGLAPAYRPHTARVGGRVFVLERPDEYLTRLHVEQQGAVARGARGLFALLDERCDGTPRVVAMFDDPAEARAALDALRRAGDSSAELEIVAALDPLAGEAMR